MSLRSLVGNPLGLRDLSPRSSRHRDQRGCRTIWLLSQGLAVRSKRPSNQALAHQHLVVPECVAEGFHRRLSGQTAENCEDSLQANMGEVRGASVAAASNRDSARWDLKTLPLEPVRYCSERKMPASVLSARGLSTRAAPWRAKFPRLLLASVCSSGNGGEASHVESCE